MARSNSGLGVSRPRVESWASAPSFAAQVRYLLDVIDATGAPVTGGQLERLGDLQAEWSERQRELQAIREEHVAPTNAWARERGIEHVAQPGA